jgi:hypothetical protein
MRISVAEQAAWSRPHLGTSISLALQAKLEQVQPVKKGIVALVQQCKKDALHEVSEPESRPHRQFAVPLVHPHALHWQVPEDG